MSDIIDIARKQIARLSEDSDKAREFISNGENFLADVQSGAFQTEGKPEDLGDFVARAHRILQVAQERIDANQAKIDKIDEFMRFGETLEEDITEETSETPDGQDMPALPPRPKGDLKLIRILKRPAFDWISFLAWVALLGLALNYWASR